ncbi:MAG: hypothetical protein ABI488_23615 [Polyangiaceae bacterium]
MAARKKLPSSLTARSSMLGGRVDRLVLIGGEITVVVPALVMSVENRAFVDRAFARVPRAKRIRFSEGGVPRVGAVPHDFLFAMFKLWASDGLEKPLHDVGQAMVDEFLQVCKAGAPVQMAAFYERLGFEP